MFLLCNNALRRSFNKNTNADDSFMTRYWKICVKEITFLLNLNYSDWYIYRQIKELLQAWWRYEYIFYFILILCCPTVNPDTKSDPIQFIFSYGFKPAFTQWIHIIRRFYYFLYEIVVSIWTYKQKWKVNLVDVKIAVYKQTRKSE